MGSLLALNVALGPELERALRHCVERREAFCVVNQRLSPRGRAEELDALGATAVWDGHQRRPRGGGHGVDDAVGLVMLTSGSSGAPKAVEMTWDALLASATLTQRRLRHDAESIWFPCLPANHIGGLAVVLRSIFTDATLLWARPDELELAARHGATHVAVVRAHLTRHDLSGYTTVLLGGAHPPSTLGENVVTTWGMTETGSGVVYDGIPLPGVEVTSVAGELAVRSPTLFRSYRTSERPRILGPDGRDDWFPTGDAGDVVDGRVLVRGRLGFVISTGGEKVWPEDLEAAIGTLDTVRDVAVTSAPDPEWGERVIALVVGDGSPMDDAIKAVAGDRIGPWAKPKEIRYVAAIPRTANGKIRRADLPHLH